MDVLEKVPSFTEYRRAVNKLQNAKNRFIRLKEFDPNSPEARKFNRAYEEWKELVSRIPYGILVVYQQKL